MFGSAAADLPDFERDALRRVVGDEPGVAEAVNKVFWLCSLLLWFSVSSSRFELAFENGPQVDCLG